MKDENRQDRCDAKGNLMYLLGPHLEDLPCRYLHILNPKTGLPTHITVGKLLDDYDDTLKKHPNYQAQYEIKFSKDEKENVMSYNNTVDHMNQDTILHDGEYWQYKKIMGHKKVIPTNLLYMESSINLNVLWENRETIFEPLCKFEEDSPVDCAILQKRMVY